MPHASCTSSRDLESFVRLFWICWAFSAISVALRPMVSRLRLIARVAGDTRSTPSFAASATSVGWHSVRYW